ncbi:hypothetical protein A6D6_02408 [Alcanivorax xiamenensis]|uniref:DUF4129 domain-containing protein n=1 Tax=Alcanivorax xiamenensis TaxID=1177156 RepID=A0ABQ6Y786_9GAMM|nr:DUF4129 domain-containing protein [Alcanivorax xiamenensis]KAF0805315.1 hypothetical protein A6D6_02408 [Alcanivorax xiamenensis]
MDLNNLCARLAPRSPWQAMDLGTRFYRRWWRQVTLVWLLFTALPYALLCALAISLESLWPIVVFWWLKPLWERPLLAFFSHALFGDYPNAWALLKRVPGYGLNGLAGQLTWRRLSPFRGLLTGIWQLEGCRGAQASARIQVLLRPPGQRAGTLMGLMVALEQVLLTGLLVLALTLVPWDFNMEFSVWFSEQSDLHLSLAALAWYLTLTITEPLYVAAAFSLYLNQRTWLEGWDLQLGLDRIGQRRRALGVTTLALLVMLTLVPHPAPVMAAEPENPKQAATELLADERFMPMEIREERQLRPSLRGDDKDSLWNRLLDGLFNNDNADRNRAGDDWQMPDQLVTVLSTLVLVALIVFLLLALFRNHGALKGGRSRSLEMPVSVAGLDTRAESLPDDLGNEVEQALAGDDVRAALALLLRHALVTLFQSHPTRLTPGATERDCLNAYRRQLGDDARVTYLEELVRQWTRVAWAHQPVTPDQARQLLLRWQQLNSAEVAP